MKKLCSISLVTAMLFYSIGYYLVYRQNIRTVKTQMRNAIRSREFGRDEVTKISVNYVNGVAQEQEIQFVEADEILYQGEMYDVISSRKEGSKVVYSCLADEHEAKLMDDFARSIKAAGTADGKSTAQYLKFFHYDFIVYAQHLLLTIAGQHRSQGSLVFAERPVPNYLNIPSPPPWLV